MELLQTLSPSASHCIKCFCDFIRILCPCRCQSAVKLKLQTEILHFHPQWKLRKSIFLTGKEIAWPFQLGHSLFAFEGSSGLLSYTRERKVAVHFCWLSLAIWSTSIFHISQRAFELFWMQPIFHSVFLWVNWGCIGETLVLGRYGHFNKILALTF